MDNTPSTIGSGTRKRHLKPILLLVMAIAIAGCASISNDTSPPVTITSDQPDANVTVGDGAYLVGIDIEPGIYRAPGGSRCYWERLSGLGGEFDDLIAMDVSIDTHQIVEVKETDKAFKTRGCGEWQLVEGGGTIFSVEVAETVGTALIVLIMSIMEEIQPNATLIDRIELTVLEAIDLAPDVSDAAMIAAKEIVIMLIQEMREIGRTASP